MSSGAISKLGKVSSAFQALAWIIVIVGIVVAGVAVWFGFRAEEPWVYGGILVEDNWESICLGILSAVVILVETAAGWAVAMLGAAAADHLANKYGGQPK